MPVDALRNRMRGVLGFPITPLRSDLSLDLDVLAEKVAEMVRYPFCALVAAGGVGEIYSLTPQEIEDVVEYVLQISGQTADAARAARGDVLFQDGSKGNCFDCHGVDGTGYDPIGSTNLTRPDLYLWGSDRASILESITRGRRGVMPAFDGTLKSEEIKAVSIFVFSHARR